MNRVRSANIDDKTINKVVDIIDAWPGDKLTWDLLIEAITKAGLPQYTRQAIERRERIKLAYNLRKETLRTRRKDRPVVQTPDVQRRERLIETLEAKVARLERENNNVLEQFLRWAYNASNAGLTEEQLNTPLPSINRAPTEAQPKEEKVPKRLQVVVERPPK